MFPSSPEDQTHMDLTTSQTTLLCGHQSGAVRLRFGPHDIFVLVSLTP